MRMNILHTKRQVKFIKFNCVLIEFTTCGPTCVQVISNVVPPNMRHRPGKLNLMPLFHTKMTLRSGGFTVGVSQWGFLSGGFSVGVSQGSHTFDLFWDWEYYSSRILLTFPHAENSCEINPSHMVFMICNFAQCI